MKALLGTVLLGTLAIAGINLAVYEHHQRVVDQKLAARKKENAERSGPAGLGMNSLGEPRKFDLGFQTLYPNGEAIAQAAFYNVSPDITTSPEKLPPANSIRTLVGQIYVTGLPDGVVIDGRHQLLWLTRRGTKTYIDPGGASHTIPAYRVAPAPPTVEARPANGAWMYEGATALDQRTKSDGLHR